MGKSVVQGEYEYYKWNQTLQNLYVHVFILINAYKQP